MINFWRTTLKTLIYFLCNILRYPGISMYVINYIYKFSSKKLKKGVPSAESSRSVRGLGKGVSGNWQALPSPVQCKETATRTRDLPVTGGNTLPLAPGPPFVCMKTTLTKFNCICLELELDERWISVH